MLAGVRGGRGPVGLFGPGTGIPCSSASSRLPIQFLELSLRIRRRGSDQVRPLPPIPDFLFLGRELLADTLDFNESGKAGFAHREVRNARASPPNVKDRPAQRPQVIPDGVMVRIFFPGEGHFAYQTSFPRQ